MSTRDLLELSNLLGKLALFAVSTFLLATIIPNSPRALISDRVFPYCLVTHFHPVNYPHSTFSKVLYNPVICRLTPETDQPQ